MRLCGYGVPVPQLRSVAKAAAELRGVLTEHRNAQPRPPAAGLVIEVGGGQQPHRRVDLTIDKYIADDTERPGEAGMAFHKPLVVADGEALPFADGAAAYVIASHVLEHAVDPCRFAGEMSRVAAAGFVQVPSRLAETTFGWPYHPWLIDLDGDALVFEAKRDATDGQVFHDLYADSALTRLWFAAHRSMWHHSVHWSGQLPVKVTGQSAAESTADVDLERTLAVLDAADVRGPDDAVRELLRCPACAGRLQAWECRACGRRYPSAGGVPVLLVEVAG